MVLAANSATDARIPCSPKWSCLIGEAAKGLSKVSHQRNSWLMLLGSNP